MEFKRSSDSRTSLEDPYKGNDEARKLGTSLRQYELAKAIWGKYIECKVGGESGETIPNIPRGKTVNFLILDILLTVPKNSWKDVGVRASDVVLLEKMVNGNMSQGEKTLHENDIAFLGEVGDIIHSISNDRIDTEEFDALVESDRKRISLLLAGKPAVTPSMDDDN